MISCLQPATVRWRIILAIVFTVTLIGAWFWLADPKTSVVPLTESLLNHPIFTLAILTASKI